MDEGGVPLYKAAVLKENTSPDLPIVGRFNYIRMLF